MSDPAFNAKVTRVADQAEVVMEIVDLTNRPDLDIDFRVLRAALEVAQALPGQAIALTNRQALKSVHAEIIATHERNLGKGDPELGQLADGLELLLGRLTAVVDSSDADWRNLAPDSLGVVVDAAPHSEALDGLRSRLDVSIAKMTALEERLAAIDEEIAALRAAGDAVIWQFSPLPPFISVAVSTAKIKELVEKMLLSGERLSGDRLGAVSGEVKLALDAYGNAVEENREALLEHDGLYEEATSALSDARQLAGDVNEFLFDPDNGALPQNIAPAQSQDPFPPGKVFRDVEAPWCPEMVVIPGGRFLMGAPEDEPERYNDEGPQHEVTVPRFALGTCAVTFAEYDHFCEATRRDKPVDQDWGRADRPVINVSWRDAQAYCRWLSGETGQRYRLPSEAEWEYACRAGTETPFWWGAEISTDDANYDGTRTYGNGKKGETREQTLPVRSFRPNSFDLWQMHGNVEEWCEDEWHDSYDGVPSDGSAWVTGGDGRKVLRGGSWIDNPRILRSAVRNYRSPGDRIVIVGFRVARTLTPQGHGL